MTKDSRDVHAIQSPSMPPVPVAGRELVPIPLSMRVINGIAALSLVGLIGLVIFGSHTRMLQVTAEVGWSLEPLPIFAGGGGVVQSHAKQAAAVNADQLLMSLKRPEPLFWRDTVFASLSSKSDALLRLAQDAIARQTSHATTSHTAHQISAESRSPNFNALQVQITAPVAGVVADILVRPGELVTNNTLVMRVTPDEPVAMVSAVATLTELGSLQPGSRLTLHTTTLNTLESRDCAAVLVSLTPEPNQNASSQQNKKYYRLQARPDQHCAFIDPARNLTRKNMKISMLIPVESKRLIQWILKSLFL